MTDRTIDHEILIDAPAEVVWRTITEPDQIVRWFADRVSLDLRPRGQGTLVFEERDNVPGGTVGIVVEEVDRPRRFAFRWAYPEGDTPVPGNSVLVEMTLSPEGDERTHLRVTETGLGDLPWSDGDKAGYAEDHNRGWARQLGRLVGVLSAPAG